MEFPLQILFISKDFCDEQSDISVDNIIDAGGLREFIEERIKLGGAYPQPAIKVFSRRLKDFDSSVKLLKQIKSVSVDVYFITPFGVILDEEVIYPYKDCTDNLPIDKLRKLFELFGVFDKVYSLIESQPDILVFIANVKILKLFELFQYIPKQTLSFVVSNTPIESDKPHIRTIYPSAYYIKLMRIINPHVNQETFISTFLKALTRLLKRLNEEMGDTRFKKFIYDSKENPTDFFNTLLDENLLRGVGESRDASLMKFLRG